VELTESTRRRMTATLFLAQSFASASMIAAFTLLPIIGARLSGSDSAAGIPSTMTLIGRALAAYPIGWLMDRVGRRFGLSVGFTLTTVGMVVAAWGIMSNSFVGFLAGVGLFGMGRGATEQSRYVAAELFQPVRRAKAIGIVVFAGTVGAVGGPLLVDPSGALMELWGLLADTGPYVVGAALNALGLILIWLLLRPDPKELTAESKHQVVAGDDAPGRLSLRQLFSSRPVLLSLAAMTIGQLVMTLIMVITPLHMSHQNHSTGQISLVIMAHTLGMFGLSWLTGGLIDRFGRLAMIGGGGLLLALSGVLTPLASTVPMLAFALFLLGLGWNFCFVAGSSLLSDSVAAEDKGRMQGAGEVVVALSSGAGSLSTGAVFASGGIVSVSAIALALVLALLAGAAWYSWSSRTSLEPA
jgi:MFS family permease